MKSNQSIQTEHLKMKIQYIMNLNQYLLPNIYAHSVKNNHRDFKNTFQNHCLGHNNFPRGVA